VVVARIRRCHLGTRNEALHAARAIVRRHFLWLLVFYLSSAHMSAARLKFHCLRYITPGYIALHFGVVVVLAEGWRLLTRMRAGQLPSVDIWDEDDDDLELELAARDPVPEH
jgi:hypothetical protein